MGGSLSESRSKSMAFRNRRDRVIVFRVTDEEYDLLVHACDEKNGRNLSDFARTELLRALTMASSTHTADLEERIAQIEARLAARSAASAHTAEDIGLP